MDGKNEGNEKGRKEDKKKGRKENKKKGRKKILQFLLGEHVTLTAAHYREYTDMNIKAILQFRKYSCF